jgi:hypothetical protein
MARGQANYKGTTMAIIGWIITKDHIAEPAARPGTCANAVGVTGPRGYAGDGSELAKRFRMYDDDGNLYYEGRCAEEDFAPLDDFGTPNAGCTHIKYFQPDGTLAVL